MGKKPETKPATGVSRRQRRSGTRLKALTIREIASEAGVSTATVSRVFNQPSRVSETTRERVLEVSARYHYVSHGVAAGLASRRSRTLGLVIPTIMNSIYADSTQAIQRRAQEAGYNLVVGISDFSPAQEEAIIHRLLGQRAEALILTGAARRSEIYEKIEHNGVPFVVTWKLSRDSRRPCISFDNYKAARSAVEYLISLGHRRIGLMCGHTDVNDRAVDRRRGFEDALKSIGLTPDPGLMFEGDFTFAEGRTAMQRMLKHRHPPQAVFAANDNQAIGALCECRESGLNVPSDISIVGFDDQPIAQCTTPQLTTIRVPASDMGRNAVDALIASIDSGQPLTSLELPTRLIIRGSAAPAGGVQTIF